MQTTRLPKKLLSITLAALAVFAVAPASQAQAGVLGQVSFMFTFRTNHQPSDQEVFNATWNTAWAACRQQSSRTRSLSLVGTPGAWLANKQGLTTQVVWNCHDNP
ncbi:hypothetical protein C8244_13535 [Paracidovorax avenae]|uniref:Uncharacterized protein n=1 Tax=Paracidovorax avenae (strain ATCC 19860 / DSM 7227 / CCUG 15838 / JCM 20985 / LMG 2117 / NCPPB 1011) TaxID=643561 RepID=F0Q8A8_PARA1|nr:hypothetical protein [Paracidovorax avenae]ADX47106.1 conserved exported protein of unknown function [Paracidovorax avenae ATCC 19860]AVS66703.1 hypothetical protein C8245_14325 [Paracidovorax avenae]AVS81969.1 hypothetical protein C8237_13290 [Paracidovorax avenae]AVT17123.1 hypothetical protein C8244_13535 [Paracidovorax avenae]